MKRFILGICLLTSVNYLFASGVKRIDGQNGSYAVTCNNGDRSGRISYQSNGQICAISKYINAKCRAWWDKQKAANYICKNSGENSRKHYVQKGAILCFKFKDITTAVAQDKGVLRIKRGFGSALDNCMITDKTNIKIIKTFKNYKIPFAKVKDYKGHVGYVYLDDIKKR